MQYQFGHYILDTDERVLLKESDRSIVSDHDRIIAVLIILAKQHPRVIPRAELLEALWPTKEVSDWALSRLIADTRRLFEENGEQEQILKTVHGVGFRLAVPVTTLDNGEQSNENPSKPSNTRNRTVVLGSAVIVVLLIAFIAFDKWTPPDSIGNVVPTPVQDPRLSLPGQRWERTEKIEEISLTEGWGATNQLPLEFSSNGVSFSPTTTAQKMGYQYFGPVNLNNATVEFDISVTQEYIDSGAQVQPYAIILFDNWRGEWNCIIQNAELSTERKTFECTLNEPGAIFNIPANESVRIGVQALADGVIAGTVTVHGMRIKHAPSFVDRDWVASNGLPVNYRGGVQYSPKDGGDRLEFRYEGPENLQGGTLIFTIEASQEYIDSGATLDIFAQNTQTWWGEWNCQIPNAALSTVGFRAECKLDESDDTLNIEQGESLLIGVISQRSEQPIKGTIKIKNVEIVFPESG